MCKETQNKDVKPEKPYEVWRGTGGQSSARSAKSVLDPPSDTFKPEGRLRTKEGKVPSESYKAPFVMGTGISVPNKADFEGINFKENIRAPPIAESLMASQLASPLRFQSPTRGIPPAGAKPSSLLAAPPILPSTDPEHEPSTSQAIAKADSSAVSSSLVTPIYTDPEKSAQEPHPSAVKLPSERAPEHVPRLEPDRDGGDSELRGPLSLKNNNLEDNSFLRELDSKLREAAKSMPAEEPDKPKDNSKDNVGSRQPQSQPEHEMELEPEPELQFKGSMNFGSPFGAPYCGKGI